MHGKLPYDSFTSSHAKLKTSHLDLNFPWLRFDPQASIVVSSQYFDPSNCSSLRLNLAIVEFESRNLMWFSRVIALVYHVYLSDHGPAWRLYIGQMNFDESQPAYPHGRRR